MLKSFIIGLLKMLGIKALEEILKWLTDHIGNKKSIEHLKKFKP